MRAVLTWMVVASVLIVGIGTKAMAADAPEGWLCVADKATGFVYNKATISLVSENLRTDSKYLVRPPNNEHMNRINSMRSYANGNARPANIVAYCVVPGSSISSFGCMSEA